MLVFISILFIFFSFGVIGPGLRGPEEEDVIDVKAIVENEKGIEIPVVENTNLNVIDLYNDERDIYIVTLSLPEGVFICALTKEGVLWIQESARISPITIGDFFGDGNKYLVFSEEIVELREEGAEETKSILLKVFDNNGQEVSRQDIIDGSSSILNFKPLFFDFTNDGIPEIVVVSETELQVFDSSGLLCKIDLELGEGDKILTAAVCTIKKEEEQKDSGEEKEEINRVVIGTKQGWIIVVKPTGEIQTKNIGIQYEESPIKQPDFAFFGNIILWHLGKNVIGCTVNKGAPLFEGKYFVTLDTAGVISGIAAGDVNGDGIPEIAAGTTDGLGYVFDIKGQVLEGWPQKVSCPLPIYSSPIIGSIIFSDINGVKLYNTDGALDGSFKIDGTILSTPKLIGNELIIITQDGKIYFKKKPGEKPGEREEYTYEEFAEQEGGGEQEEEYFYEEEGPENLWDDTYYDYVAGYTEEPAEEEYYEEEEPEETEEEAVEEEETEETEETESETEAEAEEQKETEETKEIPKEEIKEEVPAEKEEPMEQVEEEVEEEAPPEIEEEMPEPEREAGYAPQIKQPLPEQKVSIKVSKPGKITKKEIVSPKKEAVPKEGLQLALQIQSKINNFIQQLMRFIKQMKGNY